MLTVVCVLKSGGIYTPEYVYRLQYEIFKHLTIPYQFVCLTDMKLNSCETIPLDHDYPGWWSKLELFRLTGKTLYFDLDTIINGSLDALAEYDHHFTMLADFQPPGRAIVPGVYGSGAMAWQGDFSHLLSEFTTDQILDYNRTGKWGDQGWITDHLGCEPETFQTLFPGEFASHKWQPLKDRQAAAVVCYHGIPRPHETGWTI